MASNNKSAKKNGGFVPFHFQNNPFNWEERNLVDWFEQVELESKAIIFDHVRKVTPAEAATYHCHVDTSISVPVTLWDCTINEGYTKPEPVLITYQAPVPVPRRSAREDADTSALDSSMEFKKHIEHKKNVELQNTKKKEAVEKFLLIIKGTMNPAAFDAWMRQFTDLTPMNRSVFWVWNSLKSVRQSKLIESIDQGINVLFRQESHIITIQGWVDHMKKQWSNFIGIKQEIIDADEKLTKIQLLFIWMLIRHPSLISFTPEVKTGISNLLGKDSYNEIGNELNSANLNLGLRLLVECIQRVSSEGGCVNPIAKEVSAKSGVNMRSVAFGPDSSSSLVDEFTNSSQVGAFAKHYAAASGEAKALAFMALKQGKAAKGTENSESRDFAKHLHKFDPAKLKELMPSNALDPVNSYDKDFRRGGRGRGGRSDDRRGGGNGRGGRGGRGGRNNNNTPHTTDVSTGNGQNPSGGGNNDNPRNNVRTRASYTNDDDNETDGYTCVTVCMANKPCNSVECGECLSRALSDRIKSDPKSSEQGQPSTKRPRSSYQQRMVKWTPVLGLFNKVSKSDLGDGINPEEAFCMQLDSGSDQSAIRKRDSRFLEEVTMYDAKHKAPFKATSASGHELKVLGEGTISPALRSTYIMGNELITNLLSCEDFKHDCYIILAPLSANLDWRAYICTDQGRVLAVADEELRIFPESNDALIQGIPDIVLPVIENREAAKFGTSGPAFWKTAVKQRSETHSNEVYSLHYDSEENESYHA